MFLILNVPFQKWQMLDLWASNACRRTLVGHLLLRVLVGYALVTVDMYQETICVVRILRYANKIFS